MKLFASVSASSYENEDNLASLYCFDEAENHCFSIDRYKHEQEIEVMVVDQRVCRVDDLEVVLHSKGITATIDKTVAEKLKSDIVYEIKFAHKFADDKMIECALACIFQNKQGLIIERGTL